MARPKKKLDTTEEKVGQEAVAVVPSTGEARIEHSEIQVVDGPEWKEKAANLAFMEEPVTVMVHTTTDKNAIPFVEVWNDGRVQRFLRGKEQTVKRKFIEVLARAKADSYQNQEFMDRDGNMNFRYPKTTSLKYPFSVIRDDNPKGHDWLKKVLAEA